jgi:hypothetical protein
VDSLQEEAVTSELVSAGPYTGKIQGISLVLASGTRSGRLNPYYNQSLTSKFPTRRNRELNGLQQGIKSAHQGNFSPDQGTSITRPGPDALGSVRLSRPRSFQATMIAPVISECEASAPHAKISTLSPGPLFPALRERASGSQLTPLDSSGRGCGMGRPGSR